MLSVPCKNDNSACRHFPIIPPDPYFYFISSLYLSHQLILFNDNVVELYNRSTWNFSCKNKDSAFLLILIIFPDHAAVGKPGCRGISTFLVLPFFF